MNVYSALSNSYFICCLVGKSSLRPSLCPLVHGETLSLNPGRVSFSVTPVTGGVLFSLSQWHALLPFSSPLAGRGVLL